MCEVHVLIKKEMQFQKSYAYKYDISHIGNGHCREKELDFILSKRTYG